MSEKPVGEAAWFAEAPQPKDSGREPLEQLAEAFLARYRAGERPSVSDYAHQHPDLAEQIRELFPALVVMEENRPPGGIGKDSLVLSKELDTSRIPERLGEYRLLREVGRGGMGVVYEAYQESLGRQVALKALPFNALAKPTQLDRFRREARTAARLHHTNIVPVFAVGEHEGIHFYAMQFIHGQGLNAIVEEVKRLRQNPAEKRYGELSHDGVQLPQHEGEHAAREHLSTSIAGGLCQGRFSAAGETPATGTALGGNATPHPDPSTASGGSSSDLTAPVQGRYYHSVARVGLQVAEALAYAHEQGVLHRDIKPSNLLLDTEGRVWVSDFGLAKSSESGDLTQEGDIVGTLRYMAPERFRGHADPRSDVYSLAVTLYELLTLRPAFEDSDRGRLIQRIREQTPARPRHIDPAIPQDLETIVLKAGANDPVDRYERAVDLAEDLRCFLADLPIRARRTPWPERGWRWCRRNPTLAMLATAAALLLLTVAGTVGWILNERAAREAALDAQVNRALDDAQALIEGSRWPEARPALERAEQLLLGADRADVPPRLRELQQAVTMARRLEDIYSYPRREHWTAREVEAQAAKFAEAFREYGIDITQLPIAEAAEHIRARSIRLELARALDIWSSMRKRAGNMLARSARKEGLQDAGKPASPDWRQLLEVAKAADPNPWRNQLRDALQRHDRKSLEALAASADIALLPPATLDLLGMSLYDVGAPKQAVSFLREAQRQYPQDLCLNDDLALLCLNVLRPPQADEAVRFFTAARAVRPHNPYLTLGLGDALRAKHAYREAVLEFSKAIAMKADFVDAWLGRGRTYVYLAQLRHQKSAAGDDDSDPTNPDLHKALADFEKAIELDPTSTWAWNNRGVAYFHLGQTDRALADYAKAIELNPGNALAWANRARIYHKLRNWDQVIADASKAIKLAPGDLRGWLDRGDAYRNLKRWEQALADHTKAIELEPDNALAWRNRSFTYLDLEQWERALADSSRVIDLDPKDWTTRYNRGNVYEKKNELDKALADYVRVIELSPKFAPAWVNRGGVWQTLGRLDRALDDWSRAIELDPENAVARHNRGGFLAIQGQFAKALPDLSKAVEVNPKDAESWYNRASCYGHLKQYANAVSDFSKVIELDAKNANAWYGRGWAYRMLGQGEKAIADLSRAIEVNPQLATAHDELAQILVLQPGPNAPDPQTTSRAVNLAKKAVQLAPKNASFRSTLGAAHYRAGEWKAALGALEKSMEFDHGNAVAWFFLAMAHCQLGHREQAREWYDRAMKWTTENEPRNNDLKRLRSEAAQLFGVKNPSTPR
jgi:tetratricopeptide (TPR) repeat protein